MARLSLVIGAVYVGYAFLFVAGAATGDWRYIRWPMRGHWGLLALDWFRMIIFAGSLPSLQQQRTDGGGPYRAAAGGRVSFTSPGALAAYPVHPWIAPWYPFTDALQFTYLWQTGPAAFPFGAADANLAFAVAVGLAACGLCLYKARAAAAAAAPAAAVALAAPVRSRWAPQMR